METLEKKLGYTFQDRSLLENALTHSSCANESRGRLQSNERLEFLGDSILGMVVAAVYLDGGIGSARKIIQKYILSREVAGLTKPRDHKTALQELVQRQSGQVLHYRLVGEEGPDHDKRFFMEVDLNGTPVGAGSGRSKKEAEQMAAKAAIEKLEKQNG